MLLLFVLSFVAVVVAITATAVIAVVIAAATTAMAFVGVALNEFLIFLPSHTSLSLSLCKL